MPWKTRGQQLAFAMNAGMYDDDLKPIGLYVENGASRRRRSTGAMGRAIFT